MTTPYSTDLHAHRHVPLEGSLNMRDLGGLPTLDGRRTRSGVVFRADTLAFLTEADLAKLAAMRLNAVVDLRMPEECARAPDRLPHTPLIVLNAGFWPRGNLELFASINAGRLDADGAQREMKQQYRQLMLQHLDDYRVIVSALLNPAHTPLIFHCASGKDRTGVAAAILLSALDVPRAMIVQDYVLSDSRRRPVDLFGEQADGGAVEQVMSANAAYIETALDAMLETFGSIDALLTRGMGLSAATRDMLKAQLVEG